MKHTLLLFTFLFCLGVFTSFAQSSSSPDVKNEEQPQIAEGVAGENVPVCSPFPCPCSGGLVEIQLYYFGPGGVDVNFYSNSSLNANGLIESFSNVQTGDLLVVNAQAGTTFKHFTYIEVDDGSPTECKIRFFSQCPNANSSDEHQIVGKTYGDFTVAGYTDADGSPSCTLNDVDQDWHVGGNVVGMSKNTMGTKNNENVVFITNDLDRGIITTSGDFGLGTLTPSARLEVSGNSLLDGNARITGIAWVNNPSNSTNSTNGALKVDGGAGIAKDVHVGGNLGINTSANYRLDVNGHSHLNGHVGIGVTPGANRLHVNGDSYLDGKLGVNTNPSSYQFDVSGTSRLNGNTGIGVSPGADRLQVDGSSYLNGNVGVNTSPTSNELEVSGDSRLNGNVAVGGAGISSFSLEVAGESNFQDRVKIGASAFPTSTDYLLAVGGGIIAEEVLVQLQPWPDYVFESSYKLMSLKEVEAFIKENKHLPGIPSAQTLEENGGVELGDMLKRQQEKIEELTIYAIEADKENAQLKQELQENNTLLNKLLERIEQLEKRN